MSANKNELIAIVILLLVVPYGWLACIKILRRSRADREYLTAEPWKKIVFNIYYGFGCLVGPPFFILLVYSLYTRYFASN